jgi:hypothetical protein
VGRTRHSFTNSSESDQCLSFSFTCVGTEKLYSRELLEKLAVVHFVSCIIIIIIIMGRDSSAGIATRYGLDGPGIESRWGEIFRTLQYRPWGPPSLLYNEYRVFARGKSAGAW